jgi:hypothetical protein
MIATTELKWDQSVSPFVETQLIHPFLSGVTNWTVPNGYNDIVESIVDDTGDDGRFRVCLHQKETNSFSGPHIKHRFYRGWGGNAYLRNLTANMVVTTGLGLRVAPSIDMDAFASEALAFMLPRLNEGLSLVNFILELKDLKHMDPRGTYQRLTRRHLRLRDLRDPRTRKDVSKELVTRMNSAALNANFGIVPLVKDIIQIFDDLTSLASRLEGLKKYANTQQQRHYKRVVPASAGVFADRDWHSQETTTTWPSGLISDNLDNGGVRRNLLVKTSGRWIVRPTYHATLRYKYTLPEVDSQLEKVYAYLDTLGVRLDPSIVWNAIPFSFVIDWIVDVSGFLSTFARDNYPINVTVSEFCHSFKWHKEAETYVAYVADLSLDGDPIIKNGYPVRPGYHQIYHGMRSYYSRVPVSNPDIHAARINGPKLRHYALAGALMLSRRRLGSANRYKDLSRLLPRGTK